MRISTLEDGHNLTLEALGAALRPFADDPTDIVREDATGGALGAVDAETYARAYADAWTFDTWGREPGTAVGIDNPDGIRCPNCGENPGAASTAYGSAIWRMDFCESCGADPDGHVEPEPAPDPYDEPELPDDPYAYREELRRAHERQV